MVVIPANCAVVRLPTWSVVKATTCAVVMAATWAVFILLIW